MTYRARCPNCDSVGSTERVDTIWNDDSIIEVRICNDCSAEYENRFMRPVQDVTYSP